MSCRKSKLSGIGWCLVWLNRMLSKFIFLISLFAPRLERYVVCLFHLNNQTKFPVLRHFVTDQLFNCPCNVHTVRDYFRLTQGCASCARVLRNGSRQAHRSIDMQPHENDIVWSSNCIGSWWSKSESVGVTFFVFSQERKARPVCSCVVRKQVYASFA